MNVVGKIHKIFDLQQVSATFSKREFVVEIVENPVIPAQFVTFQLTQQRTAMLEGYQPGQFVDVHFNLRGRQWTSPQGEIKYFNTLEAWRINPATEADMGQPQAYAGTQTPQTQSTPPVSAPASPGAMPEGAAVDLTKGEGDDLPF